MRILIVTLYYHPDLTSANAVIVTELAWQFQKLGNTVTVVTSFPHYETNEIAPAYRGKMWQQVYYDQIKVIHTYLYTASDKQNIWGRLLNYASFNILSTISALFKAGKYDVILAPSPPLTIGLTAWVLSRLKQVPFVYNVQDIYPDIAVQLGVLTNRRVIRFFRWMEKFVYQKASIVTVLSKGFRRNLLAKQVPEEKLHIIPNFVDVEFLQPGEKDNEFARQYNLVEKFVLMYAGNVGLSQGLESTLDAAERLSDLLDFHLLIVGNGAAKAKLEDSVGRRGLKNVSFLPFQPRSLLPKMYASADLCLVSLKGNIGSESVPSKAYTIMASGRPMVAAVHPESETKRLIEIAGCGIWIPPEDSVALVDAVRQLYENRNLGAHWGRQGRTFVESYFTPQVVAQQYADLFSSLVNQAQ